MKKLIFCFLLLAFGFLLKAQNTIYPGILTESSDSTLTYTSVTLTADSVAALGTSKTLLEAPGENKAYHIKSVFLELDVISQLNVSNQPLAINESNSLFLFNYPFIQSATDIIIKGNDQNQPDTDINTATTAKLISGTNPVSGSATMTFHIFYKIIDVSF